MSRPKGSRFTVRTTVLLEEDTHQKLKDLAESSGSYLNVVIREALEDYLTKKGLK